MKIDPRRLIDLLRIAEHGSYSRAATAGNISQPALSNSIALLERSIGVRVLDRGQHGAVLTGFGEVLTGYARIVEAVMQRATEEIRLKSLGLAGSLTIGVTPIATMELVPEAVARLKRDTPDIAISIVEEVDDELLARIRSGEIDLMVGPVDVETPHPEIASEVLVEDPLVLIVRPRHTLARRKSLTLRELRGPHDWVMPHVHNARWGQMQALFTMAALPWPANCVSTNSAQMIKALVMRSDCIAIVARQLAVAECETGRLIAIPLRDVKIGRSIGIQRRRDAPLSPLARRFVTQLREIADGRIRLNPPPPSPSPPAPPGA
jgi:LysR family transcriptional regulator, regulator of abg operon